MKMSFKYIFIVLALLNINNTISAQIGQYSVFNLPNELTENANEVVRLDYMNFKIESPKLATLKVKYVVTLLNDKSRAHTQYVSYDKLTKVTNLSAKVYDAFGKEVRKVRGKEFIDQSAISDFSIYEDDRVKYINLYHNSYPYTVEIEYTQNFKGLLYYPSSYLQSYARAVEHFKFVVEIPKDLKLRYKSENIDLEPSIEEEGKKVVYSWLASSLPALKSEPYAPYQHKIRPAIKIAPTKFEYDNYSGDMSTWASFGQFMYDLNKGRDELSPEMAKKVKNLIVNAKNDQEKIAILYKYLQDNMRYVSVQLGIGGWQTFDAKYVEKNKYGDCKALSNYMKSMLNVAGIKSYQSLIYSSRNTKIEIDEDFANPGFNHVIINIPSEDIWLECTSNDYPPNYIGSGNEGRQSLLLTEEGGKIINTPAFPLDQNKKATTATFELNNKGAAIIKKQTKYIGPKHDDYRYLSNNYSKEDIEKEFLEDTNLSAFTIDKLEISNDEKKPLTVVDFHISVARYASTAGKRIFMPLNKLNQFENIPKAIEKRIHPVHVKKQYREEDTFTYVIPGDYEIESIPSDQVMLESAFGKYQISIEVKENIIVYNRLLEIYAVEVAADKYEELRNFYKEIAKTDGMKAVLVKKKA